LIRGRVCKLVAEQQGGGTLATGNVGAGLALLSMATSRRLTPSGERGAVI